MLQDSEELQVIIPAPESLAAPFSTKRRSAPWVRALCLHRVFIDHHDYVNQSIENLLTPTLHAVS